MTTSTSSESHLARNGTKILKFFLNVSKDEQRRRFLDRIDDPKKHWKFSQADLAERQLWDKYQAAYQGSDCGDVNRRSVLLVRDSGLTASGRCGQLPHDY